MLRVRGFTLIELLIALAIFGFLIMLAGPQLAAFMGNSQIRNATDAMLNGVQHDHATAVRNNTPARLDVDTTAGTGGWQACQTIHRTESTTLLHTYAYRDEGPKPLRTTV